MMIDKLPVAPPGYILVRALPMGKYNQVRNSEAQDADFSMIKASSIVLVEPGYDGLEVTFSHITLAGSPIAHACMEIPAVIAKCMEHALNPPRPWQWRYWVWLWVGWGKP
jgi:hypothetical protein